MTIAAIEKPRIVVLASGSGSNLQRLIEVSRERDFPGEIVAVGSNRPKAFALARAGGEHGRRRVDALPCAARRILKAGGGVEE